MQSNFSYLTLCPHGCSTPQLKTILVPPSPRANPSNLHSPHCNCNPLPLLPSVLTNRLMHSHFHMLIISMMHLYSKGLIQEHFCNLILNFSHFFCMKDPYECSTSDSTMLLTSEKCVNDRKHGERHLCV